MATYASGSVRIPGLSGNSTDFVSMIKKLRDVESRQVNQLLRWKQDWQTRLEAFRAVRTELQNMQSVLTGLGSMSTFLTKTTASSDEKVATAVADGDAMNVSYSIDVHQKATNTTWTRDTGLHNKSDVICELGGSFSYTYKGKSRTVTVPKNTTVEGLTKLINNDSKNPGVKAQLIQSADGIAFQLRGMDTGKASTLVIRDTTNINGLGVTLSNTNYAEAENKVDYLSGFSDPTASINSTGEDKTFVYTVDGSRRVVTVTDGMSLNDLVDAINTQTPGLAKAEIGGDSKYYFSLEKADTTYSFALDPDDAAGTGPLTGVLGDTGLSIQPKNFDGEASKVNEGGGTATWKMKIAASDGSAPDGTEYSVEVTEETTLRELANSLQAKVGPTATVKIVQSTSDASKYNLAIEPTPKVHRVTVENGTLEDLSYLPPTATDWDVHHAQNAMVRINNYPSDPDKWMEVASNTLRAGEVIPGVTFNLHSVGKTEISVATDTDKIRENILAFVDAVNSFRAVVNKLTAYDETKEVVDVEYAESLFEMQQGGVLQGNYGIQTIVSRLKTSVAGTAIGFSPRMLDPDGSVLSGDLFTSLSQIGITTNANEGEANYGLLEINFVPNQKGSKSLEQALADDPEAVAELFSLKDKGKSESDYFHYNSHIAGLTKPGTYSVSYKVRADGEIYDATINGHPAKVDQENFTITATADGPAKGLMLDVADRTPGGSFSGTVSIKTGKVNEVLGLLAGSEGILGNSGTLKNLEDNYKDIIEGIDKKILREDTRIQKWERTMVLRFARLESVLANYAGIQKGLESQIAQLSKK